VDVPPAAGRRGTWSRARRQEDAGGGGDRLARLGQRRAAEDAHDGAVPEELGRGLEGGGVTTATTAATDEGLDDLGGAAGPVAQRRRRQPGHARVGRGDLDDAQALRHHGVAEAQVQDRQLLLEVGCEQHDGAGCARGVDRRPGQAEHGLGREPVAHLGVDVVRPEDGPRELRPGVGVLVGQAGPAQHGHRRGVAVDGTGQPVRHPGERLRPRGLDQLVALADERRPQPLLGVGGLEGEAALVAQPAPVDRVHVDAEVADEAVGRALHGHAAPHRAHGAGRLDLVEVPRPGPEAVRLGQERPHRADLDGVAAEVRGEGVVGKVLTSVALPRLMNEISGSPATSLENRVHRSQRMQRSRSMWTRSLSGIGFS
jgi:hypothetical protein